MDNEIKEIINPEKKFANKEGTSNETKEEKNINEELIINIINYVNYIKGKYYNKTSQKKAQEKPNNIIQEFLENKIILKDKDKLISFIEELSLILKTGNNIIIPFLDLCPILIKSYIENDLDEEKGENELKYIKIFELLKYNSFISREYLYPLYNYFSHLFYLKDVIKESDIILNKFNKTIELMNIFYSFYPDNYPQIESLEEKEDKNETKSMKQNISTFCFLGSGLKISFNEKNVPNICLVIEICFSKNIFLELNQDLILLNIKGENDIYKINFIDIQSQKTSKEFPKTIRISIIQQIINIMAFYSNNFDTNKNIVFPEEYNLFQELIILENFYGQIEKISINSCEAKSNMIECISKPYLLNDNYLYHDNKLIKEMYFTKPHLARVNYINYLEKDFDNENYLLGIKQLIPFIPLLNSLYQNKKIEIINGINKKHLLTEAFRKIFLNFISIILEKKINENKKHIMEFIDENEKSIMLEKNPIDMMNIQRYDLFAFILILQLPPELIIRGYLTPDEKSNNFITKLMQKSVLIYNNEDDDFDLFFNGLFNAMNEDEFYSEHVNKRKIFAKLEKDLTYSNSLLFECSYQQLYRHLMKELFIYNRLWSVKEFFFSNEYNDNNKTLNEYFYKLKLKYKQISYYTKSLEQPILYPILEINEYLPSFSKFDKNKLFKHDFNETVNYDFNLKESKILQYIEEYFNKKGPFCKEKNKVQCCLVKKGYHVKGEMIIKQIDNNSINNNKNKDYYLIFKSSDKEVDITCNKKNDKNKVIKSKIDELCFGSVFSSPKKEFNRIIKINLEDINLILIRNYFKSTSAIEIFTSKNNKSYYFNFNTIFNLKDIKNPLIKIFNEIPFYRKIKLNIKCYLGGFYNINQENILYSLFSEELPNSIYKNIDLINLYDLLIVINLIANRSFKDLYQYPVFPILYNKSKILEKEEKQERDLSKHLGLQIITKKSEQRMELILGSDNTSENEDNKSNSKKKKAKDNYLFNIHYSNPIFTSYYLIRIFPYSLASIEMQGDGFDSPNRQFYFLKKSLENTLTQKSDLREFIPEMYYFPDLFFNYNNLKLGTLTNGEEINDLYIENPKEDNYTKYQYLAEFKKYFLENEGLDIGSWIDLIFGINQEKNKETGREYYPKEKYISLSKKEQKCDVNNPFNLEVVEFGLQPLKIFKEKFPDIRKIDRNYYKKSLINYNLDEFYNSHLIVKNNKDICFYLEWDENSQLNKYLNAIFSEEKMDKKNSFNITYYYKYIFMGNLLGDVFVYTSKNMISNNKSVESKEEPREKNDREFFKQNNKNFKEIIKSQDKIVNEINEEKNKNEKLLIKLSDHYRQIKYIDYHPRLNLFLSYGLDGFINLYAFPKCKLVRTIKVKDITNSDDALQKVVLISNPFPMIFFHDSNYLYCVSINGDLIKKKEIKKDTKTFPCIDKNLGLVVDYVFEMIFDYDEDGNEIYDIILSNFPSLE